MLSRWKPVCPDCGYPARGLPAPRCPECGVEFPTTRTTFRRWAVRRVAWDRVRRGSAMDAYLRTLAVILLLPWRAGRGLAVPDHWRRCLRWAGAHLALAVLACTMLANSQQFPRWFVHQIWPPSFRPPHMASPSDAPADLIAIWLAQSLLAWAIVVILPTAIAVALSFGIPGRHRAAKFGGMKWSLYLTSLYLLVLVGWYGYYGIHPPEVQAQFPMKFTYKLAPPELPVLLLAGVYGVWWAAGMASNPYNRIRGVRAFLGFGLLFAGVWVSLTWLLFPVGALGEIL